MFKCVSVCLHMCMSMCAMRQTDARASASGEIGWSELLCDYVVVDMIGPHKSIYKFNICIIDIVRVTHLNCNTFLLLVCAFIAFGWYSVRIWHAYPFIHRKSSEFWVYTKYRFNRDRDWFDKIEIDVHVATNNEIERILNSDFCFTYIRCPINIYITELFFHHFLGI